MVKISDLIAEFKLNQQIQGRKDMYIKLTTYRLKLAILHGRKLQCDRNRKNIPMHIKEYIHFLSKRGIEKAITIPTGTVKGSFIAYFSVAAHSGCLRFRS